MKRKKQGAPMQEKHVSEKTRAEVLADIRQLEQAGDTDELGSYFIQLAKWGNQPQQYENIISAYLNSSTDYLREAAIFCLLFALQIPKPEYRTAALSMIVNEVDFEIRNWASSGLGITYKGTKDRELLQVFFSLLDNEGEDQLLKAGFASAIVSIWGVSSREQFSRLGSRHSLKAMLQEFQLELQEARLSLLA